MSFVNLTIDFQGNDALYLADSKVDQVSEGVRNFLASNQGVAATNVVVGRVRHNVLGSMNVNGVPASAWGAAESVGFCKSIENITRIPAAQCGVKTVLDGISKRRALLNSGTSSIAYELGAASPSEATLAANRLNARTMQNTTIFIGQLHKHSPKLIQVTTVTVPRPAKLEGAAVTFGVTGAGDRDSAKQAIETAATSGALRAFLEASGIIVTSMGIYVPPKVPQLPTATTATTNIIVKDDNNDGLVIGLAIGLSAFFVFAGGAGIIVVFRLMMRNQQEEIIARLSPGPSPANSGSHGPSRTSELMGSELDDDAYTPGPRQNLRY